MSGERGQNVDGINQEKFARTCMFSGGFAGDTRWAVARARLCVPLAIRLLLGSIAGNLLADADSDHPVALRPEGARAHGFVVGLDAGVLWVLTDEIVESLSEHAASHLSHLAWNARTEAVGVSASYGPWETLRINGGIRFLRDTSGGELVYRMTVHRVGIRLLWSAL